MLSRLGITPEEFRRDRILMREVEHQCAVCAAQRRCRRWLAGKGGRRDYRQFCPNAEAFDRLTRPWTDRVIVD